MTTVRGLDLNTRDMSVDRGQGDEEDLARMLITVAWCQVLARTPIGFAFTPLAKTTLEDHEPFTHATGRAPGADRAPSHRPEPASASPGRGRHRPALRPALSRVVRLTLDDITRADRHAFLLPGEPLSPVPEPLAELLFR